MSQNDRGVLDRFRTAVDIGKVYGPYPSGPPFSWQLHGAEHVQVMFDKLWPWLSSIKKQQCLDVFAKHAARPASRTGRERGPCPPGCICGRHRRYSTEGLTEKQIRRREKMREYQARHRAKLREAHE